MKLQDFINIKLYRTLVKELAFNPIRRLCSANPVPHHTVVSHLSRTSTSQWLDTGIKGRSGLKIELKVKFNVLVSSYFFGSRVGLGTTTLELVSTSTSLRSDYNNLTTALSPAISTGVEYIIKKYNNKQYLNGVEFGSYAAQTFNNNLNMYLFAINTGGTLRSDYALIDFYSLKVWDENDKALGNFIPVIKDGVYCAYNEVTNTYHYSQGATAFSGA